MKTAKGHPIAPPSGIVSMARLNLYGKIGPGPHSCNWCGAEVDWNRGRYAPDNLIADHLDWDTANDQVENLVPSCNACNSHRRQTGASEARLIKEGELTMIWGGKETRAVKRFCNTCGAEFLTIPAEVRAGKGRYCSRSCMYDRNRTP